MLLIDANGTCQPEPSGREHRKRLRVCHSHHEIRAWYFLWALLAFLFADGLLLHNADIPFAVLMLIAAAAGVVVPSLPAAWLDRGRLIHTVLMTCIWLGLVGLAFLGHHIGGGLILLAATAPSFLLRRSKADPAQRPK